MCAATVSSILVNNVMVAVWLEKLVLALGLNPEPWGAPAVVNTIHRVVPMLSFQFVETMLRRQKSSVTQRISAGRPAKALVIAEERWPVQTIANIMFWDAGNSRPPVDKGGNK